MVKRGPISDSVLCGQMMLEEKLQKIVPDSEKDKPQNWEWGHEITDTSSFFKEPLNRQLQVQQELLHTDPVPSPLPSRPS